jgi:retinol dehydrogenase 12
MSNTIFLLTGSTSGIGLSTAKELVKHATTLILPVRNLQKGEALKIELLSINPECKIDLYQCDFSSLESIKIFTNNIIKNYDHIDVLANNAGVFNSSKIITKDGLEETFQVNLLSQYILNTQLLPLLQKSKNGRIINLSSAGHKPGTFDIDNLQGQKLDSSLISGTKLYFNSNLYRNLITFYQAQELAKIGSRVTVNCMHPGTIKTGLGTQNLGAEKSLILKIFSLFSKPADQGAKTLIYLCTSSEVEGISGKYWVNCKIAKSSKLSQNMEIGKQLWDECKNLVTK